MGLGRHEYYVGARRRRSPVLPGFLSIAALGLTAALFVALRPTVGGSVTDEYTGEPLGGVRVAYGAQRATTDATGRFTLMPERDQRALQIASPQGYSCANREVAPAVGKPLEIACRPTILSGTIRRKNTDAPLPDIAVRAANADGARTAEAVTDDEGRYTLVDLPAGARLIVEGPGFARKEVEIGRVTVLDLELRPDIVSGTVRAKDGKPIPGAKVGAPGVSTTVAANGSYTLANIPDEARVAASAPGYRARAIEPGDSPRADFVLEPLVVKAIYVQPEAMISEAKFNALVALLDRTELNAMVIDFKDETGWLLHDSQIPLAREIGAAQPRYDLAARLKVLRDHNIYAIARVVCMFDQTLALAKPDWAVRNSKTGGIWRNANGVAWANAMRPEVWDYNVAVALEAVSLGFEEVQFDYVRFPTDGDLDAIDLRASNTSATRADAIFTFLSLAHKQLGERGVALAADIFGIALWDTHDNGIGQQLERLAPAVDYLCPMIYPSHFARGFLGYAIPNDRPYEVILESLQNGGKRIPDGKVKFRPWLQDFDYGPGIDYGPAEVRAQIKATGDFGATGWMLWNANSTFTEAGLLPEKR